MSYCPEIQYLPIHLVEPAPDRPYRRYSTRLLERLADRIKQDGVKPIRVRQDGERWFVVSGERRRQAALAAGLEAIPCIIVQLPSPRRR